MIRKQVYIEERQDKMLKRLAKRTGVAEAEFIRRGIDASLSGVAATAADPNVWVKEKQFIVKRAKRRKSTKVVRWGREELHER